MPLKDIIKFKELMMAIIDKTPLRKYHLMYEIKLT